MHPWADDVRNPPLMQPIADMSSRQDLVAPSDATRWFPAILPSDEDRTLCPVCSLMPRKIPSLN